MKIQDWAKREDLQLEWKNLWDNNETLKKGLDVLKDVALPAEGRAPRSSAPVHPRRRTPRHSTPARAVLAAAHDPTAAGWRAPPTPTLPKPSTRADDQTEWAGRSLMPCPGHTPLKHPLKHPLMHRFFKGSGTPGVSERAVCHAPTSPPERDAGRR